MRTDIKRIQQVRLQKTDGRPRACSRPAKVSDDELDVSTIGANGQPGTTLVWCWLVCPTAWPHDSFLSRPISNIRDEPPASRTMSGAGSSKQCSGTSRDSRCHIAQRPVPICCFIQFPGYSLGDIRERSDRHVYCRASISDLVSSSALADPP